MKEEDPKKEVAPRIAMDMRELTEGYMKTEASKDNPPMIKMGDDPIYVEFRTAPEMVRTPYGTKAYLFEVMDLQDEMVKMLRLPHHAVSQISKIYYHLLDQQKPKNWWERLWRRLFKIQPPPPLKGRTVTIRREFIERGRATPIPKYNVSLVK
jgi:hypothetical protein